MLNCDQHHLSELLFDAAPAAMLILAADQPAYTITGVNAAYLAATMSTREILIGRKMFEAFPDNPEDAAADGVANLRASIDRAIKTKLPDAMAVQRYDIRTIDGVFEERWWDPLNIPLLGPNGDVIAIIHSVKDVTDRHRVATERDKALEEREQLIAVIAQSTDFIGIADATGRGTYINPGARRMCAVPDDISSRSVEIMDFFLPEDHDFIRSVVLPAQASESGYQGELRFRRFDGGEPVPVSYDGFSLRNELGEITAYATVTRDISESKRALAVRDAQNRILQLAVQDMALSPALDELVLIVEGISQSNVLASVLLCDDECKYLLHGAGPSLPKAYNDAVHGIAIGPSVGSCGTAVYRREAVLVSDIAFDPLWADFKDLALSHKLRSCWSTPIFATSGKVLGTFAMYHREPREPDASDFELVSFVVHSAALLIERKMAELRLRESEERFRAFTDATSDTVYRMSPDWTVMRQLRGREFIAESPEPSRSWLDTYVHPDDHKNVAATITRAIAAKSAFELEHRAIRADGSLSWTSSRAIPIIDEKGEIVEWFGAASDVTERKQAEETQQLLLGELNHRVKNTLATVQSIVQMTLRHTKDPSAFAEAFAGRVQSLSRVHSVLTDETWQGADFRSLIDDQLLNGVMARSQLKTAGPDIRLPPQLALHVALMLHELGTNAVKYGALAVATGTVAIRWNIRDDVLNMHWTERGGPPVRAPQRRGFGSTLIERTAKGDGGEAAATFNVEGIDWSITLPLPQGWSGTPIPNPRKHAAMPVVTPVLVQKAKLAGVRVLIIEDEPLVVMDNVACLEAAGAEVVGEVGNIKDALRLIADTDADVALLDANLHGAPVDEVAANLTARRIPFIFVTGYGVNSLPRAFANAALLNKPYAPDQLVTAVLDMSRPAQDVMQLRDWKGS